MRKVFSLKIGWTLAIFAFLDLFCAGLGMGVPIFCILFGLPVGWYIARRIAARPFDTREMLSKMLVGAALTSVFTFVGMVLLWGPWSAMLFDPTADLENLGAPLILYEPLASFIGWLVLMIVISPFLQFLMTLFGSHLTLLWWLSRSRVAGEEEAGPA
jgi:F0F1-type ATP synthase membrane subunit c/vacuolar-type H+-ATPase subunit K